MACSPTAVCRGSKARWSRELIVTDTLAVPEAKRLGGKVTVLSVAPLLAEAIRRTHADELVSPMFQVM